MFKHFREDCQAVRERDPAATSCFEIWFTYPGIHALLLHRFAHWLQTRLGMRFAARLVSHFARWLTGIEIHPAATVGRGFFIDHGMGVVIGETAEIGENVTIYQGVTLGGTGKERGKRHPTIKDNVVIGAGAKILGDITIGRGSRIGAGSVVINSVPENSTVVGIPGRIVKREGLRVETVNLDHTDLPDPVIDSIETLQKRIEKLEQDLHHTKSDFQNK
ncbi:MAG: serine O-acetyltransferase [bacterium]